MENKEITDRSRLFRYIHGYRFTQLIYVAAELKIADFLKDGPRDSHYLAAATDTHEPSLYRVLRALTTIRVFRESGQGFAMTDLARYLLADSPGSLRVLAIMRGEEVNWRPWGELLYAVKTGKSPFRKVFGQDLFEYYEKHPLSGQTFNEGMNVTSRHDIQNILDHYDFSHAGNLVEIGGGLGQLLFAILARYPDRHGILYDLPHVVRDAYALRARFQLENRCEIVGGEFFSAVPESGDVYLLKRIIHDWDDERAVKILQNCHHAMKDGGKIVV
ncbi:MAG: methyltransferase, partial [Deltaproteobacteria bacterium]|nr:methyltransferase [Deltaproteobacteria bacterium]